jgi:hypothetical protein
MPSVMRVPATMQNAPCETGCDHLGETGGETLGDTGGDAWMEAMRRGDHRAAWAVADTILGARDPATRDNPAEPYHRRWVWDGTPVRGRQVLVRCYHGLGDTLQFARFLPALRARAAQVTLEAQPELLPLLAAIGGPDRLVGFAVDAPSPPSPCDIEIMELSHALRLPPEAAPPPYLHAAPTAMPAGTIGLCWQAGAWDPARSIPTQALAPLLAASRPLYCLHPRCAPPGFLNPEGCPPGIAETARVLAGLDLVITVDSMIAHLAGALGRPTWLLLRHDADWRWMGAGERSAWYPCMRLFRQPAPGAWAPIVRRAAALLR